VNGGIKIGSLLRSKTHPANSPLKNPRSQNRLCRVFVRISCEFLRPSAAQAAAISLRKSANGVQAL